MTEANLSKINLSGVNLENAIFYRVDLRESVLKGNNLSRADLVGADLSSADLENAVLKRADLRAARLLSTNLRGATITGAKLYGTSRENWMIEGIKCDYVYWDTKGEIRTPKEREFKPGEFEELYRQMPTVEYVFEQTITPTDLIVMGKIVEEINYQNPEYELEFDSVQSQAENRAVFKIKGMGDAEVVRDRISKEYEAQISALKGKTEALLAVITEFMNKESGPTYIAEKGDIIMNGDQVKTFGQKGDAFIAKDQATVNINKITNPAAKEVVEQILEVINSVNAPEDDKADAEQQLSNFCSELEKPQPEKGRLKRFYDRMIDVIPKIAEKLPWGKIIGAILA